MSITFLLLIQSSTWCIFHYLGVKKLFLSGLEWISSVESVRYRVFLYQSPCHLSSILCINNPWEWAILLSILVLRGQWSIIFDRCQQKIFHSTGSHRAPLVVWVTLLILSLSIAWWGVMMMLTLSGGVTTVSCSMILQVTGQHMRLCPGWRQTTWSRSPWPWSLLTLATTAQMTVIETGTRRWGSDRNNFQYSSVKYISRRWMRLQSVIKWVNQEHHHQTTWLSGRPEVVQTQDCSR